MSASPTLLLVTGPAGTGKSTLAAHAAELLGASVLAWDWAMAPLRSFPTVQGAVEALPFEEYRRVGWSILWNLATAQLRDGRSVVLDGVARTPEIAGTRDVASATGATLFVVATWCSDEEVHRSRVVGRERGIPGWHELEWDDVARQRASWEPPTEADLRLDAVEPLAANVDRLTRLLRR